MQIIVAAASFLTLAAAVFGQAVLSINTVALAECQPNLLTFGGGTPPYIISAFPAGQTTGNPLETIAAGVPGTQLTWITNFPAGQTITLGIKDNTGASQFSAPITITNGGSSACLNSSSISVSLVSGTPASSPAGSATAGPSTTGASISGATTTGASAASSGTSKASATGSSASSASTPAKSNAASALSAGVFSAGPAAIFGMVLGVFLA